MTSARLTEVVSVSVVSATGNPSPTLIGDVNERGLGMLNTGVTPRPQAGKNKPRLYQSNIIDDVWGQGNEVCARGVRFRPWPGRVLWPVGTRSACWESQHERMLSSSRQSPAVETPIHWVSSHTLRPW